MVDELEIDELDHNALYNFLKKKGAKFPITKEAVIQLVDATHVDKRKSGENFVEHVNNSLQGTRRVPEINSPMAMGQKESRSEQRKFPEQSYSSSSKKTVHTRDILDIRTSSQPNNLVETSAEIPSIAPVLLYVLVGLSAGGLFYSSGVVSILSVCFGLMVAGLIPAVMPPQKVNELLSILSAISVITILFANFLKIDAGNAPSLILHLVDGSQTAYVVMADLLILCIGVAAYSNPLPQQLWTRRMSNNLFVLSCLIFFLVYSENMTDTFPSLIGSITGLWGIIILGQSKIIRLTKLTDFLAVSSLGFALFTMHLSWTGNSILFVLFGVLVVGLALLAPNLRSDGWKNTLLLTSTIGIISLSYYSSKSLQSSLIVHLLVFIVMVIQMEIRFRNTNEKVVLIKRILSAEES